MNRQAIFNEVEKIVPPELFGFGKDELMKKYDECLKPIKIKKTEEAEWLLAELTGRYKEVVKAMSEKSIRDYVSGEIENIQSLPLLKTRENGIAYVNNIPYPIADWIGLIAYVKKKYTRKK